VAFLAAAGLMVLGHGYTYQSPLGLGLTLAAEACWAVAVLLDAHRCARVAVLRGSMVPLGSAAIILLLLECPKPAAHWRRYELSAGHSTSMEPALRARDWILVDTWAYRHRLPERGDILTFFLPEAPAAPMAKRCAAREGDLVEIRGGRFLLNGSDREAAPGPDVGPLLVPEGCVYCLGDNRAVSYDSRTWGPLPASAITGRVLFRIRPGSPALDFRHP
jgi:signal peptidase I